MMKMPAKRLASESLAAKPTAMPTMPAEASQPVRSSAQATMIR